uniref:Uncharacterized protein n=1 Tax=Caenorhabditis japonica TaxID=281687 RepID=A0A8R1IEQ9_CAEJA
MGPFGQNIVHFLRSINMSSKFIVLLLIGLVYSHSLHRPPQCREHDDCPGDYSFCFDHTFCLNLITNVFPPTFTSVLCDSNDDCAGIKDNVCLGGLCKHFTCRTDIDCDKKTDREFFPIDAIRRLMCVLYKIDCE